jgi:hypothetical protein
MAANAIISAANYRRIRRAHAWLEGRAASAEEVLIVGATLDRTSSRAASPSRKALHRLNEEGRLSRYHAVAAAPGFPRTVAGVITELRLARLPLDDHS